MPCFHSVPATRLVAAGLGIVSLVVGVEGLASAEAEVQVDGERIHLGDLVGALPAGLAGVDLGPSPQPGQARIMSRAALRRRLDEAMVDTAEVRLPAIVRVWRPAQILSALELQPLVALAVAETLPPGLRLRDVVVAAGLKLSRGPVQVTVQPPATWRPGRQLVRAEVRVATGAPRALMASIDVEGKIEVRAAAIKRGAEVQIIARTGAVVVRARGVAQQNGNAGDTILVLPQVGPKLIKARIQDATTVEVEP
ncbi:MAG: flagella basal body P-ring formation protein FlgA [Deltaproteobacteria bacterium]|nr:flagella basal body P-ring formation protein FlgA [Deltaproteobacteria bacterium]